MMFVLPPNPQKYGYPSAGSAFGVMQAATAPILETLNTITKPSGPDFQFSVGEGNYVLREDIHLATPPPHPVEAPVVSSNPLSTAPHPIVAGTKISLIQIKCRETPAQLYRHPAVSNSGDTQEFADAADTDETSSTGSHVPEKFGNGNASLAAVPGGKNQKKKPKSNIVKSNSSFVSRIITHDHLSKRLAERSSEDLMLFANVNRAFHWLDMDSAIKQEPLSKILFTKAHPLCHDVNLVTRSANQIDVIIGFSTGDIIWFDPISNKYARINKNGLINSHAVTEIKWLPGSENLFLAAHNDGSLIVYDREKEDAPFVPEDAPEAGVFPTGASVASLLSFFAVRKSVGSTNQKTNPLSYWSVAKGPITGFAFSPDCEHLVVVSEDECLRVLNFVKEKLLDVQSSYYGGLMCVCWSPDGRYIVAGGQDDLVFIWSFAERRMVARCEGHHSWVSSVAFDPWRCDERTYRFGSVGNDCRLLLWDFNVGMLHKPKAASGQHRGSICSILPGVPASYPNGVNGRAHGRGESQSLRLHSNTNIALWHEEYTGPVVHGVDPRAQTAVLPPVMSKVIDNCPLSQLIFREDSIITTCSDGHIKTWDRPVSHSDGSVYRAQ